MNELISKLRQLNIKLNLVDGKLKINAPRGVVTGEIIQQIKKNKEALIHTLSSRQQKEDFYNIPRASDKPFYELSLAQSRLYFIYLLDPTSTSYNMPQYYTLRGELDADQLEKAFGMLIDRHESLRTNFEIHNDRPVQRILQTFDFQMERYDCSEREATKEIVDGFMRPFDLSDGLPIRIGLIRISSEEHILLIDTHHIINDGESNNIILTELVRLYFGETLEEVKIQYKDYSEWQNSEAYRQRLDRQKEFWKERLQGFSDVPNLATNSSTAGQEGHAGENFTMELDEAMTKDLHALARQEGVTMFILLLSIVNILISKLSREEDITIGSTVAGRPHPDLKAIVGMFVNSLPIRNLPKGQLRFREFLSEVMSSVMGSFDNQDFHYEQLINELELERTGNRNPLFNIIFNYPNSEHLGADAKLGLQIEEYETGNTQAKFDLTIMVTGEKNGKLNIVFNYATDLFQESTIKRYETYLKRIIEQVLLDQDVRLKDIGLLSNREKKQILLGFNNTKVTYKPETVLDLFEEQVQQDSTRPVLWQGAQSISYGELNERVNRLAHYLHTVKEIGRGDVVALYLDRSSEMLVGLLAVLKSGAAYLPMDEEYGAQKVRDILTDAKPSVTLTNLGGRLSDIAPDALQLNLQAEADAIAKMPTSNPAIGIQQSDLAYILYTSGSTGKPKGILIAHSSLQDYAKIFQQHFAISDKDRVIQQASLAFDTSIEEIFPALSSGASLHIMPDKGRDTEAMIEAVKQHGATVLSTTPLVLNELNKRSEELTNLRLIISGGELLLPAHIDCLIEQHEVYNTYGPSESTVCITYHRVEDAKDASCIGRPIANRQVYITDAHGHLCPSMVPGELCVSGEGLAIAYLNNPELTAEKFVPNPFVPGQRMYRTGDLAQWRSNGEIEFLGRIDKQVKIRGVRIELGEIEHCLAKHPVIEETAVVVKTIQGEKQLVAYYVSAQQLESTQIRAFLSEQLPTYMLPSFFIAIEQLPMTTNGKLAIRKLPNPNIEQGANYTAPVTDIEKKLVAIWSEVLHLSEDKISTQRSFFELGGHSLRAINVTSKIEKEFNVKLRLQTFFQQPTIKEQQDAILLNARNGEAVANYERFTL
ncbi:MAG: amino acid adenylation domain-containing protein [Bacteroidota bacterium]